MAGRMSPTLVWLSYYQENTPGVEVLDNTSTALGLKSEPQPDGLLRILPDYGGRTRTDRRFVRGVPELVVEVSHTSRYTDLGPKLDDYQRAGVQEYIVRAWNLMSALVRAEGRPVRRACFRVPTEFSAPRSFPGLWLNPEALIAG